MASHTIGFAALLGVKVVEATLYKESTPPMGWNSYNYYSCNPSEEIIKSNAQGLVDLGLVDLGYKTVTTDCGWMGRDRDEDGRLVWNATLFPSGGGSELGEFLHGLGLKYGLYSGSGYFQCGSTDLPASLGYEDIDAQSFAEWGGDSLKYDNCWVDPNIQADYEGAASISPERHQKMASILDGLDHDISYYICQWGVGYDLGDWASPIGNTYRISNDIYNSWRSIWRITNQVVPFWRHTTVGAYPDMDMLIVGLNALSAEEERFHFSMWAINKTPLKIGAPTNLALAPAASFDILRNAEVIAINQDALGAQARLVRRYTEEEWDVWAGELSGGRRVLGLANWRNDSQTVQVDLAATLNIAAARARDVWAAQDLGVIGGGGGEQEQKQKQKQTTTFELKAHEMKLLVLSDIVAAAPELIKSNVGRSNYYYAAATNATLDGGAKVQVCGAENGNECLPAGSKIIDIAAASGASVTFSSVAVGSSSSSSSSSLDSSDGGSGGGSSGSSDTKKLLLGVDFINYEVALQTAWDWGSSTRNMTVAVNGGEPKRWAFPISGGDWTEADRLLIEVDGFVEGEDNQVVFAAFGESGFAPDLVGFEVFE